MYSTAGHVTVCVQEIMSWNWSGSNNAEVLSQAYTDADPLKKKKLRFLKFRATRKKYGLFGLEYIVSFEFYLFSLSAMSKAHAHASNLSGTLVHTLLLF
jgi:hypothetical protein